MRDPDAARAGGAEAEDPSRGVEGDGAAQGGGPPAQGGGPPVEGRRGYRMDADAVAELRRGIQPAVRGIFQPTLGPRSFSLDEVLREPEGWGEAKGRPQRNAVAAPVQGERWRLAGGERGLQLELVLRSAGGAPEVIARGVAKQEPGRVGAAIARQGEARVRTRPVSVPRGSASRVGTSGVGASPSGAAQAARSSRVVREGRGGAEEGADLSHDPSRPRIGGATLLEGLLSEEEARVARGAQRWWVPHPMVPPGGLLAPRAQGAGASTGHARATLPPFLVQGRGSVLYRSEGGARELPVTLPASVDADGEG